MNKQQLRTAYLQKRQRLSPEYYDRLCAGLLKQFITIDLDAVNCLHLFITMQSRKEPDTAVISSWIKQHRPHIKLVYPKANFAGNTMQSFADDKHLQLAINKFGITEPISGLEVAPAAIDMILVPLLAFDGRGYRVGYGKGFYDRFIAQCRPDVQLVGLSFFGPVEAIDDLDAFDKPLTACITPGRVYRF